MRWLPVLLLLGAAPADEQRRLTEAKRAAVAASERADALTDAAERAQTAAARARAKEAAVAMRVRAAAARVAAAEARVALVARAQGEAQARLARAQAPAARLLAALLAIGRQPAIATVAQPGSIDDLVHVRAVLGTQLPVVRARAQGLRTELTAVRRLEASAALAARALHDSRAGLERDRVALAMLAASHRRQAASLGDRALSESDRALALGERARDLIDRMTAQGEARTTVAELATLPGPLPRPLTPGAAVPPGEGSAYRLPVRGTLVTGFGEISSAGGRSRGLTFAVAQHAPVIAPAGGIVRYARPFRGFGTVVVIDHGDGWTSVLTGLGRATVRLGQPVAAGTPLGRAARGDDPEVTVELRRRGRPADIAALIG